MLSNHKFMIHEAKWETKTCYYSSGSANTVQLIRLFYNLNYLIGKAGQKYIVDGKS